MFSGIIKLVRSLLSSGKEENVSDEARLRMQKNFVNKNEDGPVSEDFIESKMQSMKDSQGESDFSGASVNGPGNVARETRNSNMSQRNFQRG